MSRNGPIFSGARAQAQARQPLPDDPFTAPPTGQSAPQWPPQYVDPQAQHAPQSAFAQHPAAGQQPGYAPQPAFGQPQPIATDIRPIRASRRPSGSRTGTRSSRTRATTSRRLSPSPSLLRPMHRRPPPGARFRSRAWRPMRRRALGSRRSSRRRRRAGRRNPTRVVSTSATTCLRPHRRFPRGAEPVPSGARGRSLPTGRSWSASRRPRPRDAAAPARSRPLRILPRLRRERRRLRRDPGRGGGAAAPRPPRHDDCGGAGWRDRPRRRAGLHLQDLLRRQQRSGPRITASNAGPNKVKPVVPDGKSFPNTDKKLLNRLGEEESANPSGRVVIGVPPPPQSQQEAADDPNAPRKVRIIPITPNSPPQGAMPVTTGSAPAKPPGIVMVPGVTLENIGAPQAPPSAARVALPPPQPQAQARAAPPPPTAVRVASAAPEPLRRRSARPRRLHPRPSPLPRRLSRRPRRPRSHRLLLPPRPRAAATSPCCRRRSRAWMRSRPSPTCRRSMATCSPAGRRMCRNRTRAHGASAPCTAWSWGRPASREAASNICSKLKAAGYKDCWVTQYWTTIPHVPRAPAHAVGVHHWAGGAGACSRGNLVPALTRARAVSSCSRATWWTPEQVRRLSTPPRAAVGDDILVLIDQEGGRVCRLKPPHWRPLPAACPYAKAYADDPAERPAPRGRGAAQLTADLRAAGINTNCAPLLDVPAPGSHDIIGDRAFGANPEQRGRAGRAVAEGQWQAACCPSSSTCRVTAAPGRQPSGVAGRIGHAGGDGAHRFRAVPRAVSTCPRQ